MENAVNLRLFLACLSPEEIRVSVEIGRCAAAFAIGITLAMFFLNCRQGRFAWLPLYGSLVLLHPAWTVGPYSGDCGYAKRFLSGAVSLVFVGLLICQIFLPRFGRRRFIFILCGVCWAAYLPLFFSNILHFPLSLDNGLIGRIMQSFVASSNDLFRIALALSILSFVLWLFELIRKKIQVIRVEAREDEM
jgi:hypothetical protein